MPSIAVTGADLYYEARGTGTPILGIHGTPSSAILWADAADKLSTLGMCVIYDRRGFLRSTPRRSVETLDLADHVSDAVELLGALSLLPAVVVGRSTGGLIALELARLHPERVQALVLLEPAVFTVDPASSAWAAELRARVLTASSRNPGVAAEAVAREALGDDTWESLPDELRAMFASTSPAVLAEIRGHGLDLGQDPLALSDAELADITTPTLIVSADDSPVALRRVCDRLAGALPAARTARVAGGHLITPAHTAVLDFVGKVLATSA